MWLFVFPNEPDGERPHIHMARMRGPKGQNIKIWLDTLEVAKAHKSYKMLDIRKAMRIASEAYDLCMSEWRKCHGEPKPQQRRS